MRARPPAPEPARGRFGLSRRGALKALFAAGGAAALGGGALYALRGEAPEVPGLLVLSAHGYRTMASLAAACFPELEPGGALRGRLDLARAFDRYLAGESPAAHAEARYALTALEYGPVLFERRASTFSHLPAAAALAHFDGWARSGSAVRRRLAAGLSRFLAMLFYDCPEVWASIGYDGPLIGPEGG